MIRSDIGVESTTEIVEELETALSSSDLPAVAGSVPPPGMK